MGFKVSATLGGKAAPANCYGRVYSSVKKILVGYQGGSTGAHSSVLLVKGTVGHMTVNIYESYITMETC